MGEGSGASFCGSQGGCYVGGGGVAEDEEFYEGADEDYDGELAEEKALCEGEAVGGVSWCAGALRMDGELTRTRLLGEAPRL